MEDEKKEHKGIRWKMGHRCAGGSWIIRPAIIGAGAHGAAWPAGVLGHAAVQNQEQPDDRAAAAEEGVVSKQISPLPQLSEYLGTEKGVKTKGLRVSEAWIDFKT